jgi:hypothetical protein
MPTLSSMRLSRLAFRSNLPSPGEDNAVFAEDDGQEQRVPEHKSPQCAKALPPTPPPSYRSYSFGSTSANAENDGEAAGGPDSEYFNDAAQLNYSSTSTSSAIGASSELNPSQAPFETTFRAPVPAKERLLVELRAAPLTDFEEAISLKNFSELSTFFSECTLTTTKRTAPLAAEHIKLAQQSASAISESLRPLLQRIREGRLLESVLVLCPRGRSPSVITFGRSQDKQVNLVKAYILDTQKLLTLVSVKYNRRKSFVLIRKFHVYHYRSFSASS